MRPAALLGLFALLAACGGAAVEGSPSARRIPGRPAPGVTHVECAETRHSRCFKEGFDACDAACGDGDAKACLSLASLLERGFKPDLMDEGEPVEKDPARALELRRLACRLGLLEGCYEVVTLYAGKPDAVDVRAPLGALELACKRDPVCGCAFFGSAILGAAKGARDIESLKLLDNACERGAMLACDNTLQLEELCRERPDVSPACAPLREQGRVRPPEPTWNEAPTPQFAIGCFRVEHDAAPPQQPRGSLYCFAPDRYFERPFGSPSWDQRSIRWYRYGDRPHFRAESSGESFEITADGPAASAVALRLSTGESSSQLVRLDAREAAQPLAETSRLPKVEDECARAHRCSDAVARALQPPPSELEYGSDAPPPERPTNLLGCVEERREALDRLKRAQPRSEPPPDCRPAPP